MQHSFSRHCHHSFTLNDGFQVDVEIYSDKDTVKIYTALEEFTCGKQFNELLSTLKNITPLGTPREDLFDIIREVLISVVEF